MLLLFTLSGLPVFSGLQAQIVLTESPVAILSVSTGGQEIPEDSKIDAELTVWWEAGAESNTITDTPHYAGSCGIELRGSSSLLFFPKVGYGLETRESDGSNRNFPLLGMPAENDWVLHGPYSDKTLFRNALAYRLAAEMAAESGRYVPRVRWCELIIDGDYRGLYLLTEKIKVDRNRVDLARVDPGDIEGLPRTGGYILKIDKLNGPGIQWWNSQWPPLGGQAVTIRFQAHHPNDLPAEQLDYLIGWTTSWEQRLWNIPSTTGHFEEFGELLDVGSFIDYFLITEASRNVDGYRLSAFFYKDRDDRAGRMVVGPPWDFNLAWGNVDYYDGWKPEGWQVQLVPEDGNHIPFWWGKLLNDLEFVEQTNSRWNELRADRLDTDNVHGILDAWVDTLGPAIERNFERWPVLDEWVWPNPFVDGDYASELGRMKDWIESRFDWMDANLPSIRPAVAAENTSLSWLVNPVEGRTLQLFLEMEVAEAVGVELIDMTGRTVQVLLNEELYEGHHFRTIPVKTAAPGLYLVRMTTAQYESTRKVLIP